MVTFVLLPLMIGTIEFGFGFRDWLSVSSATREGARVGSAAGDNSNADCVILEATAGALTAVSDDQVQEVWVFESDTSGNVGTSSVIGPPSRQTTPPAWCVARGSRWKRIGHPPVATSTAAWSTIWAYAFNLGTTG